MSPIWLAAGEEQSRYPCFDCLENFPSLVPPRTFTTYASGSRVEICKGPLCDSTPNGMPKPPGRGRIGSRSNPRKACRLEKMGRHNELSAIPEHVNGLETHLFTSLASNWVW